MDPDNSAGTDLPGQDLPEETPIPQGGDRPEAHLPERQDAQDPGQDAPDLNEPDGDNRSFEEYPHDQDPPGFNDAESSEGAAYEDQRFDQNEGFQDGGPEGGPDDGGQEPSAEDMQELESYLDSLPPEEQEALINELMESQQGGAEGTDDE